MALRMHALPGGPAFTRYGPAWPHLLPISIFDVLQALGTLAALMEWYHALCVTDGNRQVPRGPRGEEWPALPLPSGAQAE